MKGKSKCKILKDIRRKIAAENGIEFVTSECKYQGDCSGTCPKCESEVRYLEAELEKRKKAGRAVAVAGIAATMLVGCASAGVGTTETLQGDIPATETTAPSAESTTPESTAPETSIPESSVPETTETLPVPGEIIWETEAVDGELVLQGDVTTPSEEDTLPAGMIPPPPETEDDVLMGEPMLPPETEDDVLMGEPALPPETEYQELMGEPPVEYGI